MMNLPTRNLAALVSLLTLSGLTATGCGPDAASADTGSTPTETATSAIPHRRFQFTYAVTVPAPAAGTTQLRVWVPLPRVEAGVQQVAGLTIQAPDGWRETESVDYGNRFLYAEIANPTGPTALQWSAVITRYEDRGQGTGPVNPRDLQENRLIPFASDPDVKGHADRLVTELGLGEDTLTDAARARRIYEDVLGGMTYDKTVPGYGQGDFLRSVTVCKGNCTDFHARFMGVGRRAGLPVRFTMGIPMKTAAEGTYNSYHCWAHWYDTASDSWKPVDISEADKVAESDPSKADWYFGNLNVDRVTLTYGRDLALEPRQSGELLNYAVFPHAEADGTPVELGKQDWAFSWKNVE